MEFHDLPVIGIGEPAQHVEHDGRRQSLGAWVRELGNPHDVAYTTISARVLKLGWPVDRALRFDAASQYSPTVQRRKREAAERATRRRGAA